MPLEFRTLSMMELRSSPGEILDRVYKDGEAFVVERSGQQKACLVPISLFLPDIPKDKINELLDEIHNIGDNVTLTISNDKQLEIRSKSHTTRSEVTFRIVLPHGYPNAAPRIYASPIRADAPHRWQDGALCIFGAMANWNPGKHTVISILDLARTWLSHYESWDETGMWPHPKAHTNG